MSTNSLPVFDKTLQTTHIWLDDIMEEIGPDRQVAWHVLGGVLRVIRDRIPADLAAHLGAELPLLVRGTYYDQYRPVEQPLPVRSRDEFLEWVSESVRGTRPVDPETAVRTVFGVLSRHIDAGQAAKIRAAMPLPVQELWTPPPGA